MAGVLTAFTFDLMTSNLLSAGLPFTNKKWGQKLNAPGPFSGELLLSDSKLAKMAPVQSTHPGRTILVVDLDGSIVWGGIIWTRGYQQSTRKLTIGAIEFESYLAQRIQAADYETGSTSPGNEAWWNPTTGAAADACRIAAQVIQDAIDTVGSALSLMSINLLEATGNPNPIVASYPISSPQAIDSIIANLVGGGYGTGFDYGFDVSWGAGPGSYPVVACNISYPRRGRIAGSTGLVVAEPFLDYQWPENATPSGNTAYGTASGLSLTVAASDPAPIAAGYPLLEQLTSYSSVNTQSALQAAVNGDLAQLEWPVVTPKIKVPVIGPTLAIGDFIMGDDGRVIKDPDERFANGFDTYMRIVQNDVDWPDQGLSTMELTFGQLPGLAPVPQLPIQ